MVWMSVGPPCKIHVVKSPSVAVVEDRAWGPWSDLTRDSRQLAHTCPKRSCSCFPTNHAQRRGQVSTQEDSSSLQAKRRGLSTKPTLQAPWPWPSQPLELWERNFCCWSHLSLVICYSSPSSLRPQVLKFFGEVFKRKVLTYVSNIRYKHILLPFLSSYFLLKSENGATG